MISITPARWGFLILKLKMCSNRAPIRGGHHFRAFATTRLSNPNPSISEVATYFQIHETSGANGQRPDQPLRPPREAMGFNGWDCNSHTTSAHDAVSHHSDAQLRSRVGRERFVAHPMAGRFPFHVLQRSMQTKDLFAACITRGRTPGWLAYAIPKLRGRSRSEHTAPKCLIHRW